MCAGNGVKITSEVQVHFFHRHDLRIAATGCSPLHAKVRAKRRLADTNTSVLANAVQTITQTHCRCGLALAGRCGIDRCHKDQFAVVPILHRVDERLADLGLVMAIGQQITTANAKLGSNLLDRLLVRFTRNLNIRLIRHFCSPHVIWVFSSWPAYRCMHSA